MKPNKTTSRPGVIVLGAETQGLGIIRQLGEAGIDTVVVDQDAVGVARFSKYCNGFFRSPPYRYAERFVHFLERIADEQELKEWTIFPTDDEQVKALSIYRDRLLERYSLWTQAWDKVSVLYHKGLFYKYANQCGLSAPGTCSIDDIRKLCNEQLEFPVIVKPTAKEEFYRRFKRKAIEFDDYSLLRDFLIEARKYIPLEQLLIQERIPGSGDNQYSLAGLFDKGEPVFFVTARRVRQHPLDFGHASTYVKLMDIPELVGPSMELMRAIGYSGVCEIEFMLDPRSGEYRVLEVNPRFWGWHTITRSCGVNLPEMLFRQVYGMDRTDVLTSRDYTGSWVKNITDIPVSIKLWNEEKLGMAELLKQYVNASENATFWSKDPLPFFAEWVLLPYLWSKRGY
ncbi:MAG: ATP-grasp domain-containing protein [Sphaerochaetaceae bacterium]|nr:ATP-grasp domain-containing protein [Sphaerochaetaceae bacterium]